LTLLGVFCPDDLHYRQPSSTGYLKVGGLPR
jgi:hypothetical protein